MISIIVFLLIWAVTMSFLFYIRTKTIMKIKSEIDKYYTECSSPHEVIQNIWSKVNNEIY